MEQDRVEVPVVAFYGDRAQWPITELLYSEQLEDRSSRHDWRIRAHRHDNLTQLFLLLSGSGTACLDSDEFLLKAPLLLLVPEGSVHEFVWQKQSTGFVLSVATVANGRLQKLSLSRPYMLNTESDTAYFTMLFSQLHAESNRAGKHRDAAIDNLLDLVCISIDRFQQNPTASEARDRSSHHFGRFLQLVETHHKSQWAISDYADRLGISPAHLNSICRKRGRRSSLSIIHSRLLLAARRALTYTEMNVSQVADSLGFNDSAYFTRFFKRLNGMTPREYRRRAGTKQTSQ